jgi:Penicillin amidase
MASVFRFIRNLAELRNWHDFVEGVSHCTRPTLNLVFADTIDNIGYYVTGRVPIRKNVRVLRSALVLWWCAIELVVVSSVVLTSSVFAFVLPHLR